ncbi:TlpA disulfide reductase family protein [Orrella sp. JC864]|uniref:TlpA family protein disulfide reductase n=1 Tax=Orrella sp. JC864 TaxID=3120298 RepID=UPI0012BD6150
MKRRVFLSGAAGVAAMAAGGWMAWRVSSRKGPGGSAPAQGQQGAAQADAGQFMQLALPDVAGRQVPLSSFAGQPMLVNFWATWCPPCVKEMPDLEALQKKFPQVRFVGIGIDTAENIRAFTEKVQVSYPLLVAGHQGIDIVRSLGNSAGGLPFTVVFDADGRVNRRILGQVKPDDLARTLSAYAGRG